MNNIAGLYKNIWTQDELNEIVEIMQTQDLDEYSFKNMHNECRGIDENNVDYYWFMEVVFKRLQDLFGEDVEPVFGMYLHETNPWGVHTDAYHCAKFPDRIPSLSILMPLSLDNDVKNLDKGFTIVFNETIDSPNKTKPADILALADKSNDPNCALNIYDEHLTHNPKDIIKHLTVKDVLPWELGSVIYWDSLLLHDSNNFLRYGLGSKQAIVIHTFKKSKK